jgi:hypothetical protein
MTQLQFINHISGNKSPMGSIEVPIDRSDPDKQLVKFPDLAIHF